APKNASLPFTDAPANLSIPFTEGPVRAVPARILASGKPIKPARSGYAMVNGVLARWAD
ncbi:hypothetical protein HDU88_000873, partial [Geranomyces variabilis]